MLLLIIRIIPIKNNDMFTDTNTNTIATTTTNNNNNNNISNNNNTSETYVRAWHIWRIEN